MMKRLHTILLTTLLLSSAGAANAAQHCGAVVHTRFDETRASFQNALGACRPDGYCSVVVALTGQDVAYAQQLRIARPTPGAAYIVELVAVDPMNVGDGQPMSASFGRRRIDLAGAVLPPQQANLFRITEAATVEAMVNGARRSPTLRWTYQSEAGPVSAWFALSGVSRALRWIDCIGAETPR